MKKSDCGDFPYEYLSLRATHIKYMNEVYRSEAEWFRYVSDMRPDNSWDSIVQMINANVPKSGRWTGARLQRAARAYVAYGILPDSVFGRSKARNIDDRLPLLADSIRRENSKITLVELGRRLKELGEQPPGGGDEWNATTVMTLLSRADRLKRNSNMI